MAEFRRFFAEQSERLGNQIHLTSEYNHIAKVLRLRPNDKIVVCFNDGLEHLCNITQIDKATVYLDILQSFESQSENSFFTTLFVGTLKGDKNEFVVQKAVELGVNEIVFFSSLFSVSKFDEKKIERLNKISIEASKQCGRAYAVPVCHLPFENLLAKLANFEKAIVCFEREKQTTLKNVLQNCKPKSLAIVIGSEGGFSDQEVEKLTAQNAVSVTLGKRILRAETAPIYVLSVIDSLLNFGEIL